MEYRTLLSQERHLPLFMSLSDEETQFVWEKVYAKWHKDFPKKCNVMGSADLFFVCRTAGLDHARVVLALAGLNGDARPIIEKLAGCPIRPWYTPETPQETAQPGGGGSAGQPPGPATAHVVLSVEQDTRVVLTVAPNPHKRDSFCEVSYRKWRVGATVAQCRARGLTAQSVRRDVRGGYVTLGER